MCIAHLKEVHIEGELVQGLCILKSESVVPFLSITTRDGDLQLSTEQGINPDKIDKGCLILDYCADRGYYVLTFDRSGGDTRFWVREFLGVEAVPDSAFLTNAYAKMAVSFLEEENQAAPDDPPWQTCTVAKDALDYFEERERFDLQEFSDEVLKTPEAVARFDDYRARMEAEQGQPLETSFEISKKDVTKAKKRLQAVLKLDTGVEIHVKPGISDADPVLERGFDDSKGMRFIKIYFNKDLSSE